MDVNGKTILITGSTDGVGRYVARQLAARGARVLIHGRDAARAKALTEDIKRDGHAAPTFYKADLSSLSGARQRDRRSRADRRLHQQCRDRLAERRARTANQRGRL